MLKKFFIGSFIAIMFSANSSAQNPKPEDELQIIEQMTKLTEQHRFLHSFEGKWKIKGISYTIESQTPVTGTAEIKVIFNGHYVEMNLQIGDLDLISHSRITLGFDTRNNKFTLHSIDDFSNSGLSSTGERNGDEIIFNGKDYSLYYTQDILYRIVIKKERENKISYKFYNTIKGKEILLIKYYFFKIRQ